MWLNIVHRNFFPDTTVPLLADVYNAHHHTLLQYLLAAFLLTTTSLIIWKGSITIIKKIRSYKVFQSNFFAKLFALCVGASLYSLLITAMMYSAAQNFLINVIAGASLIEYSLFAVGAACFFSVAYENYLLNKELEIDNKVFLQLDKERVHAEMNILKNELNPHFIFNSLTALSHLVKNDADKAYQFTHKLSQVYKYFLINRDKEFVTLEEEMDFIYDYFFLLQIRHDNNVKLNVHFNNYEDSIMILPCALQILVENAIKHNGFSDEKPLEIDIELTKNFIVVKNSLNTKLYAVDSTKIGLKNLSARYKLSTKKDIITFNSKGYFIVKLPLVKQQLAKSI